MSRWLCAVIVRPEVAIGLGVSGVHITIDLLKQTWASRHVSEPARRNRQTARDVTSTCELCINPIPLILAGESDLLILLTSPFQRWVPVVQLTPKAPDGVLIARKLIVGTLLTVRPNIDMRPASVVKLHSVAPRPVKAPHSKATHFRFECLFKVDISAAQPIECGPNSIVVIRKVEFHGARSGSF